MIAGLVLTTAGLGVVNPLLIEVVFDRALFPPDGGPRLRLLVSLVVVMLSVAAAGGVLGVWQTLRTNRLGQEVMRELRNDLYVHLQRLPLSFYARARTGELQSRIASDVGGVQTAVTTTVGTILSNAVTFASAVIAMALLSVPLTLLSLVTVPFFVWATRTVGRKRRELTRAAQEATADMTVVTGETLSVSGITLARLFGRQDAEIARFADTNARLADVAARQQAIGQAFFTVITTFLGATPVLVYLLAGLLLAGGNTGLTAGTIVAVTTLQTRLFFPVARLLETVVELQSAGALFERIFRYLDTPVDLAERPDAINVAPAHVAGEVSFRDVTMAYETGGDPALDRVSFTAQPGQLVAFVGPSGAGKTTILSLVARLYDPQSGAVMIDGIDVRDLSFASLARIVGVVTQEAYLFAGSLRDNIAYGYPEASDAEVEAAARAAAIHDRIAALRDGYDTVVGERGFRLSGGERQRVAIARTLLADPKVLVLDEATSALDTVSERQIQASLGRLVQGRTTLVVAHRLSTVTAADVIHVVEDGRIVASGSHEELLAFDGLYRTLYHEQFDDGRIETRCEDGVVLADGTRVVR